MNKAKEISALWSQIKPQIGEMVRLCHEVESHAEVTADAYQRGHEAGYKDGYNEPGKGKIQVGDEVNAPFGKASCQYCEYEMCSDRADPCRICACNYMNLFKPKKQEEMDGLRQNIQTIVDQCGYTLDEIAEVLQKMKES